MRHPYFVQIWLRRAGEKWGNKMEYISGGVKEAFRIIIALDREFLEIVMVSLRAAGISTALATVVGVLIEVPVMLMLVKICLNTPHWFREETVETTTAKLTMTG